MDIQKKVKNVLSTGNIALGVLACAGVFCVLASIEAMQRNYALRSEVASETRAKYQLELEIAELEYQKIWRASEEYQELALKSKMNLVEDGEKIIDLPEPSEEIKKRAEELETNQKSAPPEEENLPNWRKWVKFLLDT